MEEQRAGLADLARVFLKLGAMSYGGPGTLGRPSAIPAAARATAVSAG
jgi:chromate transport protein ChrA